MRSLLTLIFLVVCHLLIAQNRDTIIIEARSNNTFNPDDIVIKSGQTVIWKNVGGFHNVNGSQRDYPGNPRDFKSGDPSSETWEYAVTFDKPGFYQYRCDPHFAQNMVGSITVLADLVITEIMYNPPETGLDLFEYIEIYNNGTTDVNLKNHRMVDGITLLFPGYNLGAGEYLLLAENAQAMSDIFGLTNVIEWQGSLDNNGEPLALLSPDGLLIDELSYLDGGEWPVEGDGTGASIVLCNIADDNSLGSSWKAATTPTGRTSNGVELIGNPGASSQCAGGPVIGFVGASVQASEADGFVDVQVSLESGVGTVDFKVSLLEENSTATPGIDFDFVESFPSFSPDVTSEILTVSIPIIDDQIGEDLETIALRLSNPSPGASIDPASNIISINLFDNDEFIPNIVISEINYNSPDGPDAYEFIELYNNGSQTINLRGYNFSQGINFTFPDYNLTPGEFVIVAKDSVLFESTFELPAFQWGAEDGLQNAGETIELRSPSGMRIDSVTYDEASPWDTNANGLGPSLDLCDVNSDNENPGNWKMAIAETGIEVEGNKIFASPGELRAACQSAADEKYPSYPIGLVTTNNKEGVTDSLFVLASLQGVVHGINFNAGNEGLSFTIIDRRGDGINVFSRDDFGYTVREGDEVRVKGEIVQFNGLTEIQPDSLTFISSGNKLVNPKTINSLGEDTESQLIRIEEVWLVNPAQWTNLNTGFNVEITNGDRIFTMRIDADTDIFGTSVIQDTFSLTGIGSQSDRNAPFTDGYRIFPRYRSDFDILLSNSNVALKKEIQVYPNPTKDWLNIQTNIQFDRIILSNALGQRLLQWEQFSGKRQIDTNQFAKGLYNLTFLKGDQLWTERIFVE